MEAVRRLVSLSVRAMMLTLPEPLFRDQDVRKREARLPRRHHRCAHSALRFLIVASMPLGFGFLTLPLGRQTSLLRAYVGKARVVEVPSASLTDRLLPWRWHLKRPLHHENPTVVYEHKT